MSDILATYLKTLNSNIASGNATEHTHRSAFEIFIEALRAGIDAVNEPRRSECGAPDFVVTQNNITIGYIEAKDIGVSLSGIEKTEQLKRYRHAIQNLLVTNYLEFRWYVGGELRASGRLGRLKSGNVVEDSESGKTINNILQEFFVQSFEPIRSAEELARRMARIADMICAVIEGAFEARKESYNLLELRKCFAKTLLPGVDLKARTREFADMYAQTIAYGLFAARCNHDGKRGPFQRIGAALEIPKTNPLLRSLFESITGTVLEDEPFALFVEDLVQLLANADLKKILEDFGSRTRQQDPVVHFYETFLKEYDPNLRELRGVYYTPEPVVNFIVRSVDIVLKKDFGLPDGLADTSKILKMKNGHGEITGEYPKVLILDPACGTGTFLYAVVDHIRNQLKARGQAGMWSGYVRDKLLPRLFGFELLMASYAVAHFKLGLQLAGQDLPEKERKDWSYDFIAPERLNVFLTNTLEHMEEGMIAQLPGIYHAITEESIQARKIKRDLPIMVILGNPPYSGHSANASWKPVGGKKQRTFIGQLIEDYKMVDGKPLGERNPKWIQDDYVKFIRWAQWKINNSGYGVVSFITNHAYLDNPTFRGMRQSLLEFFDNIYILNLHGNSKRKEKTPEGAPDQNVFDIQQGVSIVIMVRKNEGREKAKVRYGDVWGKRAEKYKFLDENDLSTIQWNRILPRLPSYWFVPWNDELEDEYCNGWRINDLFPINSAGLVTARDKLTIGWSKSELLERIENFVSLAPQRAREKYDLGEDVRDWKVEWAQKDIIESKVNEDLIKNILYRPFDKRYTYYTGISRGFICMPRKDVMEHLGADNNIGLSTTRSTEIDSGWEHAFVSDSIIQHHTVSLKEINYLFPLFLDRKKLSRGKRRIFGWKADERGRIPNLDSKFTDELSRYLSIDFEEDSQKSSKNNFVPKDVLQYIYAIFYAPSYRKRYSQFLKADFPRIPLISNLSLFRKLCVFGNSLISLHLLDPKVLLRDKYITSFPRSGTCEIIKGYPKYKKVKVYINEDQYFEGVPGSVWRFRVGGYQVAEKWLKDRRGQILTFDEIDTYQKIILALDRTIKIMQEIDAAIPGWPLP